MERAKRVVDNLTPGGGEHHHHHGDSSATSSTTTRSENTAAPVVHETIKPHHHEEVEKVINKEIHQDHHRRIVQPVKDRDILPEEHRQQTARTINREFDNRDTEATERALRAEAERFKDERKIEETTYTTSRAPTKEGEAHVHHHVYQTVQPVIEKETVQPQVMHTTVPIHEVHHEQARDHGTKVMPAMSMDEFNKGLGKMSTSKMSASTTSASTTSASTTSTSASAQPSSANQSSSTSSPSSAGKIGLGQSAEKDKKPSLLERLNPLKDT